MEYDGKLGEGAYDRGQTSTRVGRYRAAEVEFVAVGESLTCIRSIAIV
jgi:hypothetical protein